MSDKHEIEIPVSETERKKAELLCQATGTEDFSDLVSNMIEERFGDTHPDALLEDDLDLDALLSGDLDLADVPAEYKIGNYDAADSEVASDE